MSTTDADFRRRVEADARRAGMSADLAAALAKRVGGKQPRASVIDAPRHRASATGAQRAPRASATGAQGAPVALSTRNSRLDALARVYSCPANLTAELKRANGSLRTLADVLARAGDGGKVNTAGRVERARLLLAAREMQRSAA